MIQFVIPGPLVSVNSMYKTVRNASGKGTRRVKTFDAIKYKVIVACAFHGTASRFVSTEKLAVFIEYTFPDRRRRDVTNYDKAILDNLVGLAFKDDTQIYVFAATKRIVKKVFCAKVRIIPVSELVKAMIVPLDDHFDIDVCQKRW